MFKVIEFNNISENGADGTYDGRQFSLIVEDEDSDSVVEGNFTGEERQFIWAQWEMKL